MTSELIIKQLGAPPVPDLTEEMRAVVPVVVAGAGSQASYYYIDFFTTKIRNPHTRSNYFHDCRVFLDWCSERALEFEAIRPMHVAAYIESRSNSQDSKWHLSKTSVKRHMSALRMMFSHQVEKGVLSYNPAREVATEKVRRKIGKTPEFEPEQVAQLLESFGDATDVVRLRDRALLGVMAFGFSRISAIVNLRLKDYIQQGRRAFLHIEGKGGVEVDIPVHHALAEYLDSYIEAAGIAGDKNGFIFRNAKGSTKTLTTQPMSRVAAWKMVQRRLDDVGIGGRIGFGCHSFRATCGTNYLENGGDLEVCQDLMGHADPRTTKLYDRRKRKAQQGDIERIRYVLRPEPSQ